MTDTKNSKQTFERYDILTPYEFTINLHDDYQHKLSGLRVITGIQTLRTVLDKNTFLYHVKTEISEPHYGNFHNMTRLHFHGVILFKTIKELNIFLKVTLNQLFKIGQVCINEYRPDIWDKYIRKQKYLHRKEERQCGNIKYYDLINYQDSTQ
jgi:hypothetical protein